MLNRTPCLSTAAVALCVLPAVGQTITEDHKLLRNSGVMHDNFGDVVAIDNGIVAIGASSVGSNSGAAYLFDAGTGSLLFALQTTSGTPEDRFGYSIAIDNGIVAIGAVTDNDNGTRSGAAYLFDASTGQQIIKLHASDGAYGDNFGCSIAIDDGIVVVGAYQDEDNGENSGSAYVFDVSTGAQIAKLLPEDWQADAFFGNSVDIDNGIVAVTAQNYIDGSAYLFDASTGAQLFQLLPSDGEADDQFGHDIAIEDNIVAVGAPRDDDNNTDSGSVYLFNATTGARVKKLLANDGGVQDRFGRSVAIENGVVAIGAWGEFDDNGAHAGAGYLFDVSTGLQITKFLASDGEEFDHLGISIGIDNGIVVAGADGDDDHANGSGAAYLFTTPAFCPADLNADGAFDFFDVYTFIVSFTSNTQLADLTNDARWDMADVSMFIQAATSG
ncbi:MAG: FG-GAP repeat protein, partial [bacterium]|nr:FG-GAP repeat protein [bacterium]